MNFAHDPNFWGFCVSFVGAWRYLMKVRHEYRIKALDKKFEMDTALFKNLKQAVDEMKPVITDVKTVVAKHSDIIKSFEATATRVFDSESRIAISAKQTEAFGKDLGIKMTNLGSSLMNTNLLVKELVPRLEKIETEIVQMRNGYVFVTTKK